MIGMRTSFISQERGMTEIQVGRTTKNTVLGFHTDNLADWFPFNPNFVYRYSEGEDNCYLYPLEKDFVPDYNMYRRTKTPKKEHTLDINGEYMLNKRVQESNREVMDFAESLGILTIEYPQYTLKDVLAGYYTVRDYTEDGREVFEDRLLDSISYETMMGLEPEVRSKLVYEQASEEELEDYTMYAKVRQMLMLMEKIARA